MQDSMWYCKTKEPVWRGGREWEEASESNKFKEIMLYSAFKSYLTDFLKLNNVDLKNNFMYSPSEKKNFFAF
jgi:hypothetical protein